MYIYMNKYSYIYIYEYLSLYCIYKKIRVIRKKMVAVACTFPASQMFPFLNLESKEQCFRRLAG
jgi:hypothetical protein